MIFVNASTMSEKGGYTLFFCSIFLPNDNYFSFSLSHHLLSFTRCRPVLKKCTSACAIDASRWNLKSASHPRARSTSCVQDVARKDDKKTKLVELLLKPGISFISSDSPRHVIGASNLFPTLFRTQPRVKCARNAMKLFQFFT